MLGFFLILFTVSENNKNSLQLIPNNQFVSNILEKHCTNHNVLKVGRNTMIVTGSPHNITIANRFTNSKEALLSKANGSVSIFKTSEVVEKASLAIVFLNFRQTAVYIQNMTRFLKQLKTRLYPFNIYLGNKSYKL